MAFELFMKVTDINGLIYFSLLLIVNYKHDAHKGWHIYTVNTLLRQEFGSVLTNTHVCFVAF